MFNFKLVIMKKLVKLGAMLIGSVAFVVGGSSCEKEETQECCTITVTYDGITESDKYCEDDIEAEETYTWSDFKSYGEEAAEFFEGGLLFECDDEPV